MSSFTDWSINSIVNSKSYFSYTLKNTLASLAMSGKLIKELFYYTYKENTQLNTLCTLDLSPFSREKLGMYLFSWAQQVGIIVLVSDTEHKILETAFFPSEDGSIFSFRYGLSLVKKKKIFSQLSC
jgi:hypothetical protein